MIATFRFGKFVKVFIVLTAFILGFGTSAIAQFEVYGIIVTPKNKKHHGKVINYEPQESVTMACQGDTLTFDLYENEFKFTTRKPPKKYNFPDGLRYHRVFIGSLAGRPNDGSTIAYSYHYQRTRLIGYGGGVAFENYGDADGYDFIVPRLNFYSFFIAKNRTPFIKADVGYGIAIKNTQKEQSEATGGINAGVALGYRLSTNRVMLDFTIGTRIQKGDYVFDRDEFLKYENNLFRRLEIGIGFMW